MILFVHDFLFIVVMTALFPIYAYWLPNSLSNPEKNTEKSCYDWIISYGFQENDVSQNRDLAQNRVRQNDGSVYIWAVIYAHELVAYNPSNEHDQLLIPYKFCYSHGMENNKLSFYAFESFENTCEGWLILYRYNMDFPNVNFEIANTRNVNEDKFISLWTANYARYLCVYGETWRNAITIGEFCNAVVKKGALMNFMSLNDTTKTCKEWIEQSGYNDTISTNVRKAIKHKKVFDNFINSWTKLYIEYLRNSGLKKYLSWCGLLTDTEKTCLDWLISYGFREMSVAHNRSLANYRERQNDENVYVWAVIYAHELTAFYPSSRRDALLTPYLFCDSHSMENNELPFSPFKDYENTCEGWILLYKYHMDFTSVNYDNAMFINTNEEQFVSLWATGYARYVNRRMRRDAITISKFCSGMVNTGLVMPFMSLHDTRKTCKEWIELSGYINITTMNVKKARKHDKDFDDYINSWTKLYIEYLLNSDTKNNCIFCSTSTTNDVLIPLNFCETRGYTERVKYYM